MFVLGQPALMYESMRYTMKSDQRLAHVKLSRRRGNVGGLGICGPCENLKERLYMGLENKEERKKAEALYVAHLDDAMKERVALTRVSLRSEKVRKRRRGTASNPRTTMQQRCCRTSVR